MIKYTLKFLKDAVAVIKNELKFIVRSSALLAIHLQLDISANDLVIRAVQSLKCID
jgi:hypothetical protein